MRTFEEFHKEFLAAHDCKKCHGKIVCVTMDMLGNRKCAYCNQIVDYPSPTKMELAFWITMIEDKKLLEALSRL